jgi:hypothetical protein
MDELVNFLRACFAEDRAVALAATPGPWRWDGDREMDEADLWGPPEGSDRYAHPVITATGMHTEGYIVVTESNAAHIARWDPAHVISECDAKLLIVDAESRGRRLKDSVTAATSLAEWVDVTWVDESNQTQEERIRQAEFTERFTEPSPPSKTLKLLALPYADRPGYREEWRP